MYTLGPLSILFACVKYVSVVLLHLQFFIRFNIQLKNLIKRSSNVILYLKTRQYFHRKITNLTIQYPRENILWLEYMDPTSKIDECRNLYKMYMKILGKGKRKFLLPNYDGHTDYFYVAFWQPIIHLSTSNGKNFWQAVVATQLNRFSKVRFIISMEFAINANCYI